MRRVLLDQLPAFAHFFGILPSQVDDLTMNEIKVFMRELEEMADAPRKAERDQVREEQRKRLGLGPPVQFAHRS